MAVVIEAVEQTASFECSKLILALVVVLAVEAVVEVEVVLEVGV